MTAAESRQDRGPLDPRHQHRSSVLFSTVPDTECATLPATARTANIGPCIGHYQAGPLQLGPSRWLPAKPTAVCAECRCSAHFFSSGVRTHNRTASGPSLVTRTGANPVSVVCSGISLCGCHSTGVSYRQPAADIRVCRPWPSLLCRHNYAAGAANSLGKSAGVEQSASTDQRRLVAAVFSMSDKGPSVSAVVQQTSDYCTII